MSSFAERYVNTSATGGGDGLSEGTAWTIHEAATNYAPGLRLNIKNDGTYHLTGTYNINSAVGSNLSATVWEGYNTTPGDGGFAHIEANGANLWYVVDTGQFFYNLKLTTSATGGGYMVRFNTTGGGAMINCILSSAPNLANTTACHLMAGRSYLVNCYIECSDLNAVVYCQSASSKIYNCYIRSNRNGSLDEVLEAAHVDVVDNCILDQGDAAVSYMARLDAGVLSFRNNIVYGGLTGVELNDEAGINFSNNIIYSPSGALGLAASAGFDDPGRGLMAENFIGGFTTRSDIEDSGHIWESGGGTLTEDPFIDAPNGNFRLKDYGDGLICKTQGMGVPVNGFGQI